MLRKVTAIRYVAPLREGGSLPALVEADDDGLYVVKFRGAGQGMLALVAEVVAGEMARAVGLPVPEIVLVEIGDDLVTAEPDPEIQALVQGSAGLNVGLDFLPGSLMYSPAAGFHVAPDLAAAVIWLDSLVENVDRTPRNPNLLTWHDRLWLIDHGAALYRSHWGLDPSVARRPFAPVREHVLLPEAYSVSEADARLAPLLGPDVIQTVVESVPPSWMVRPSAERYASYLTARLEEPRGFVDEAERARGD
ncbi:MAG: aminotransferase class I and II [Thermoleophilaceae bacterium]|nr:aminotransferase class I and II [Thermoleophilaceae bacterium]